MKVQQRSEKAVTLEVKFKPNVDTVIEEIPDGMSSLLVCSQGTLAKADLLTESAARVRDAGKKLTFKELSEIRFPPLSESRTLYETFPKPKWCKAKKQFTITLHEKICEHSQIPDPKSNLS